MRSRYLLSCAPLVGRALSAGSDCSGTTTASTSTTHDETPTRYVPFRNLEPPLDLPTTTSSRPPRVIRVAVGDFPVESLDGRYEQNVERATDDPFTDTLPAGLPFPLTRTRSSETIPVVTQTETEIITVTDSTSTTASESSAASETGHVTSSASESRWSENPASRPRTSTWTTSTTATSTTHAPETTSSSPAAPPSPPRLSTGATVGIVVGVVATLLVTLTISLSVRRCRKKKSEEEPPEPEPLDKRLIGYPYPAPRFSQSFSRALAQTGIGEDVQQQAPRPEETRGRGEDTAEGEGSHVRHVSPEDGRCAPGEEDGLVAGYQQDQQNQGSRDTIRDILSAYSSVSCYSQDGGVGTTSGPANNAR